MPVQLPLEGFEPPPPLTDGLFFAVLPDAATAERIAALAHRLRGELGLRGKPLAATRLHATLHHLGNHAGLPPGLAELACRAGDAVVAAPFEAGFDHAESFLGRPRNRPFVLRGGDEALAPLGALQRQLGAAMRRAGLGHWVTPHFTPHVTLLYDGRFVTHQAVAPVQWTVREFVLVHSLLGRSTHLHLARWPLAG
ncbi:2'-5' RNA ligase family protein [Aquincola sp. MAHUQ-54]|uniref:2'-5' RNA ligase family protein n=1 Tax=Aquincola agrisoli TaxID=3119538 RepID=A0AAW9QA41_9BURK